MMLASNPLPPLAYWLAEPSRKEWWIARVPILGWLVAHLMRQSHVYSAAARAHALVCARPTVSDEVWGSDPARRELAYFLRVVLEREIGWAADRLRPDDAMSTLCHLGRGLGLGRAVRLAIEDRLHAPLPPGMWDSLYAMTLDQAIDALLPGAGRQCINCDYILVGNPSRICPECGTPNS